MRKKILSVLLCAVLAVSGTVSANAAGKITPRDDFSNLREKITIPDDTIKVYAFGIDRDEEEGIVYQSGSTGTKYEIPFKKAISSPKAMILPANEMFSRCFSKGSGNDTPSHSFATTGGTYKKVKIKLSSSSDYFNEDGSHTMKVDDDVHDYKFKYENMGNGHYYDSSLVIISGGVITAVTPDENGEVEFYVSTDVGAITEYTTTFSFRTSELDGGGGGTIGRSISQLTFGNVDGNKLLDVDDVTTLQLYLAGLKDIDTLGFFHANTNGDNYIDVEDVTTLQFGLAGL